MCTVIPALQPRGAPDVVRLVLSPRPGQLTHPHGRSGGPTSGASYDAPWGEAHTHVGSRTPLWPKPTRTWAGCIPPTRTRQLTSEASGDANTRAQPHSGAPRRPRRTQPCLRAVVLYLPFRQADLQG